MFDLGYYDFWLFGRINTNAGWFVSRVKEAANFDIVEELDGWWDEFVATGHEITACLCRWCHAKVHKSWADVTDDVGPDPEAISAKEKRKTREREEQSFESATERFGED